MWLARLAITTRIGSGKRREKGNEFLMLLQFSRGLKKKNVFGFGNEDSKKIRARNFRVLNGISLCLSLARASWRIALLFSSFAARLCHARRPSRSPSVDRLATSSMKQLEKVKVILFYSILAFVFIFNKERYTVWNLTFYRGEEKNVCSEEERERGRRKDRGWLVCSV